MLWFVRLANRCCWVCLLSKTGAGASLGSDGLPRCCRGGARRGAGVPRDGIGDGIGGTGHEHERTSRPRCDDGSMPWGWRYIGRCHREAGGVSGSKRTRQLPHAEEVRAGFLVLEGFAKYVLFIPNKRGPWMVLSSKPLAVGFVSQRRCCRYYNPYISTDT